MAVLSHALDIRTTQFLDSTVKIDGVAVKVHKLAEVVGIAPEIISQELSSISISSTEPIPNIRKLGLYAGLAQQAISITGAKTTSITIDLSDPLKVDFIYDKITSSDQDQTITIDVKASSAKQLAIDPKKVKLLRSSVTVLDQNGKLETTYTAFNTSPETLRCLELLCDSEEQHRHGHVLDDLSNLICQDSTIHIPTKGFAKDRVTVILQRN